MFLFFDISIIHFKGDFSSPVNRQIPSGTKFQILSHVADGFRCMYNLGYQHSDVKPGNIAVQLNADGAYEGIIIDLGAAQKIDTLKTICKLKGNVGARTAEYINELLYLNNCDTVPSHRDEYALGVSLEELVKPGFCIGSSVKNLSEEMKNMEIVPSGFLNWAKKRMGLVSPRWDGYYTAFVQGSTSVDPAWSLEAPCEANVVPEGINSAPEQPIPELPAI